MVVSLGAVAALIAAVAFGVLVGYMCVVLIKLTQTLTSVQRSIDTLTTDVRALTHNVDDLVQQSTALVTDVTEKSRQLDTVVAAADDVAKSVSDLNQAGRNLATKVAARSTEVSKWHKAMRYGKMAVTVFNGVNRLRKKRK